MTQVSVRDLGPIGRASVDIKPLTIFVGPNNSGKSYMSLAIYCLSRTLAAREFTGRVRGQQLDLRFRDFVSPELLLEAKDDLAPIFRGARSVDGARFFRSQTMRELPQSFQSLFEAMSQAIGEGLARSLGPEIQRVYGTDIERIRRRAATLLPPNLAIEVDQVAEAFRWRTRATEADLSTEIWQDSLADRAFALPIILHSQQMFEDDPEYVLWDIMFSNTEAFVAPGVLPHAHYMPASRSGLMLGHKTFSSLIVGEASRAWIRSLEIPRLPGFVTDLIQNLLLMTPREPHGTQLDGIIDYLESEMAHGTIRLDDSSEYPTVYFESETGRFQLYEASSMVSEIAPIVLYLKHIVRPGDMFIIEEPESHIDADNQRRLARAIAMLVNAGVKVLITTHSDFLVSQLANLVMLSGISPRRRAGRRYKAEEVLQPDDVGAYMFEPSPDGSIARPLAVDAERGIPLDSFTDVHTEIYDEAIDLEYAGR